MRFLLAIVLLIGLIVTIGCGSDTAPVPQAQATQPPVQPTSTPIAPEPTTAPESTATPVPGPTDTPLATATPEPTATLAPTATPNPTPRPSPTPGPDREALLRASAIAWGNAIAIRDWATVYSIYSDEFQAKCPLSEFAEFSAFVEENSDTGIPRGATYVLDSVIIEGDYAWVNSHFVKDGRQIFQDEDQYMANEPAEVVWTGDSWVQIDSPEFLAQEQPCSLEQYMGYTINLPLPVGSDILLEKGKISVTGIVQNATQLVMQEFQYNALPKPGNHFYMVGIEVEHYRTGSEPISINYYDFELIGENRQLYDPFEDDCELIPNELRADLYPGGTDRGNICFEVADTDSGFILIYKLSYDERIFLRLD